MTTLAPGAAPSPVAARDDRGTPSLRTDLRLVSVFVVLLVLTQRIGLPAGGQTIAVTAPLAFLFAGVLVIRRRLVLAPLRTGLFLVAVSSCLLASFGASWLGATWQMSLTSLALLVLLYVPWVLRMADPDHGAAVVQQAGRTFLGTMLVLAVVGMVQLSAQFVGLWTWADPVQDAIPASMYVFGYNYDNEVTYGFGIFKSTAFVLLEPSFLSQFCALAILIGIMLRVRAWQLLVLIGGMASAISGTGLLLLAVGGLLLVARAPRRLRPGYVVAGVAGTIAVLFTPVADFLLLRSTEFGAERSSANARFSAPYEEAWIGLLADPSRFFVGAGPGSVSRVIPGELVALNPDVLYSIPPKLAFEYGMIAGGLFALFLVVSTVSRAPWRVIPAVLVFMTFVLSGALLQPQTIYLVWLLSGIGAIDPPGERLALPMRPVHRPVV